MNDVPQTPRRWTAEVDGIRWLPRMIDKARMSAGGTLGSYLMGHSPVDRAMLARLAIGTKEFVEIATTQPDDTAVLSALRLRGFDEPRLRRWSARFEEIYRWLIPIWDLDEGYTKPSNALERIGIALLRRIEGPVFEIFRMVSPAP